MIKFFKKKANKNISDNKKVTENQPAPKIDEALLQNKIKELADKFLNSSFLDVKIKEKRVRITAAKWLYSGYRDKLNHAIIPHANGEKIATEIIQEKDFVNSFMQNKRDLEGVFGYFVARVESNYVYLADNGNKIFSSVSERDIKDYDTLVLIKQCKRLFPKINPQTLSVDLKHIEIFGEIFNKLKAKLSVSDEELPDKLKDIMAIDVPSYSDSAIKIENSEDAYYIVRLMEIFKKLSQNYSSVEPETAIRNLSISLKKIEKVKDNLYVSENTSRFLHAIENLEKVTGILAEILNFYYKITGTEIKVSTSSDF